MGGLISKHFKNKKGQTLSEQFFGPKIVEAVKPNYTPEELYRQGEKLSAERGKTHPVAITGSRPNEPMDPMRAGMLAQRLEVPLDERNIPTGWKSGFDRNIPYTADIPADYSLRLQFGKGRYENEGDGVSPGFARLARSQALDNKGFGFTSEQGGAERMVEMFNKLLGYQATR